MFQEKCSLAPLRENPFVIFGKLIEGLLWGGLVLTLLAIDFSVPKG